MLLGALIMASCDKEITVESAAKFNVTTEGTSFKAGTPIKFKLTGGEVQRIAFYSGEAKNDYAFKDGRLADVKGAGVTMTFTSSLTNGEQATQLPGLGNQNNQLTILASTDFNGDYSSIAKVKAATWKDITSRFVLGTSTSFVSSGIKDIADLVVAGKPLYIAFKYVTKPQATNGIARIQGIQTFAVSSTAKLNNTIPLNFALQNTAAFRIVDENPVNAPARSSVSLTRVTLYGNQYFWPGHAIFDPANTVFDPLNPIYDPQSVYYVPTAVRPTYVAYSASNPRNDPLSENWAVSRAITIGDQIDLGPDLAKTVKTMNTAPLTEFIYTTGYVKPGTYKAVFVASNASKDDFQEITRGITLTITP